ncbi:hypothetical protein PR202_gb06113 [Eleusine coracana subsp. coracana]|uniref:Uncharacterized protein n=1 Tax=Eleusine coracana subsp. coracana TaxID=191504 RepID=A0AAV5E813_ELECO|nr:hypothetical protein PR202_gb06113 [Eleusine coracana subsp. coracana]
MLLTSRVTINRRDDCRCVSRRRSRPLAPGSSNMDAFPPLSRANKNSPHLQRQTTQPAACSSSATCELADPPISLAREQIHPPMAPAISFGFATGKRGAEEEAEVLRRRNAELESEVAALRAELDAARRRAETAEEAEERLCVQLGEAEVEAVEIALEYQGRVDHLARELAAARAAARTSSVDLELVIRPVILSISELEICVAQFFWFSFWCQIEAGLLL